ncbi:peptidyl-prolyl cis-trans isomerase [bacterium]|nr:peptidyl-prolyl cis-trans isomerase [bacterium]
MREFLSHRPPIRVFCLILLALLPFQETQAQSQPGSRSAEPSRETTLPLYRRYPPQRVVVGEVGDDYMLTRAELEQMAATELTGDLDPTTDDSFILDEIARRKSRAEEKALHQWAVLKTITLRAKMEGLQVTDSEIDQRLRDIQQEMTFERTQTGPSKALVIDEATLRREMRDALLVDRFILRVIQQRFTDQDLETRYRQFPGRYTQPEQMHAWQIVRAIPLSTGEDEKKDLRAEFYKNVFKPLEKKGGTNFEEIAREESSSPVARKSGGDLGWIDRYSNLPPQVLEALIKLKPGEISRIVETPERTVRSEGGTSGLGLITGQGGSRRLETRLPGSFHILRVTEHRPAQGETFDEYARKRVIDDLILEYKAAMGDYMMKTAPFSVKMNATGLRLTDQSRTN